MQIADAQIIAKLLKMIVAKRILSGTGLGLFSQSLTGADCETVYT